MTEPAESSLRRRAARRVLETASRLVTRARLRAQPGPAAVADLLLLESQHAGYVELHRRFTERAQRGEGGLASALDALDAMWAMIRQLRAGAPAVLQTLSNEAVQERRARFYLESTRLLEDAIRAVFASNLGELAVPPQRTAVLVRVALEGLVVELAQARNADDVATVDQAYADFRALFERFVLHGEKGPAIAEIALEPIALPW
jgi:hypothetical protein